ncbi:MAG: DUF4389 domain-containing protein [Pseudomonadota bacterium]
MTTAVDDTTPTPAPDQSRRPIWERGLYMLFFIVAIGLAQTLINFIAVVQFLSLLITRETNTFLTEFGASLGTWLEQTAKFQSGGTEEKPFPWASWPKGD